MKNQYRDLRGLIIPDDCIKGMLDEIGKTEDEVIAFLGEDVAFDNGRLPYFLDMMVIQKHWIDSRNGRRDDPLTDYKPLATRKIE